VIQLGYRHDLAASNLRRSIRRTATVGALLQDVSNSFSSSLLRFLDDASHQRDVAVLASSLDEEPDRERQLVASLVRRRVDGLLLMPATDRQDYLADDLRAGLPVVFVDRRPHGIDADSVTVDNALGARLAAEHLAGHGHRRIAFLGDLPQIETAASRLAGFRESLSDLGRPLDDALVVTGLRSEDAATQALLALLDDPEPPTAVFAARNTLAVGAVRALRHRSLAHSTALVGFDDFPLSDLLDPPLTVLRQDVGAIGAAVVARLFARIDGDTSPPQHVVITPRLLVRGSGELRP
jgi:LacI family transcriptional regulator